MEIFFYHLEQSRLEKVIPQLLEKTLERGWKAVIETVSPERAEALDETLWTYRDDSFLPHSVASGETGAEDQIVITNSADNPNSADVRFYVDRAVPSGAGDYVRLVYLFDGHDPDAVVEARQAWKALTEGNQVTYWQQDGQGRWDKKA